MFHGLLAITIIFNESLPGVKFHKLGTKNAC